MPRVSTGVLEEPLDPAALTRRAHEAASGAVVTFEGVVRDHDAGQGVTAIDYSAHPDAPTILAQIARDVAARHDVHHVEAWHRVGHLGVGDVAMVVVVGSAHRAAAFEATRDLVDEVKKRLPVWKKQHMSDGTHAWSGLP